MGKPHIEIDGEQVFELAKIGCKTTEIAAFFQCSRDTIERRFAAELEKGRADVQMSLRRWQIDNARNGNVVMQIWLGKQMLGQEDRMKFDISKIPNEVFIEEAKRRLGDGSEES